MSETIRQSELRNDNAAVMRRVAAGESFVVTVNGKPVADVIPHHGGATRRRFVPVAEAADLLASQVSATGISAESTDVAAWQADLAAADDVLGHDDPVDPFDPIDRDPR